MSPARWFLFGLVSSVGCGFGEESVESWDIDNLDGRIRTIIEGCGTWNDQYREWCTVQSMGSANLSGSLIVSVCERMVHQEPADQCWEQAVRQTPAAAGNEYCERIESALLRDSCQLTALATSLTAEGPDTENSDTGNSDTENSDTENSETTTLAQLLTGCDRTGGLRAHCAELILNERLTTWEESDDMKHEHMTHDVGIMVSDWYPPLREDRNFGLAVGTIVNALGLEIGDIGACEVFEYGPPKLACIHQANQSL